MLENKKDILIDYFFVSFHSAFSGLKQMLTKNLKFDEIEKIERAVDDLLETIKRRQLTEVGGAYTDTLSKKTKDMIEHLQSISKMNMPPIRTKNIVTNEKNQLLLSKTFNF